MARVSLHFEDAPDGLTDFRSDFKGGWNPDSPAHKLACTVISFLDKEAKEKQNLKVTTTDEIQNGAGKTNE